MSFRNFGVLRKTDGATFPASEIYTGGETQRKPEEKKTKPKDRLRQKEKGRPDFSLAPIFTLPLSDNARIYRHQIRFSANVSCILIVNGGYVAPARKKTPP